MDFAFVDGAPATFDGAVQRCAEMLASSTQPLFAHLGADIAGVREAVRLAEMSGGVLEHAASEALLRDLDPLRQSGGFATTPMEADVRADVVLMVGDVAHELPWLSRPARPHGEEVVRQVIRLAEFSRAEAGLVALAQLRAQVKLRPAVGADPALASLSETLRGAKFGLVVWRASDTPALAVEAIHGLVRDLNETTRFSTLSLAPPDNALGVQAVCGWMTGFPLRTSFARGRPEHDPWRFDARRLIAAGETDCVVWVSAFPGGVALSGPADIVLDDGRATLANAPRVRIVVSAGGPAAVAFDPRVGTLTARWEAGADPAPTVAATLAAVRARLEAAPC